MSYVEIGGWVRSERSGGAPTWTDERGNQWSHDTTCDIIAMIDEGVKKGGYVIRTNDINAPFWIDDDEARFVTLTGTPSLAKAVRFCELYQDLSPELLASMIQHSKERAAAQ